MEEMIIGAFRIAASRQGMRLSLPDKFLSAIQASTFSASWLPPCQVGKTSTNIASAGWLPRTGNEPPAFYGQLTEVRPVDEIELLNLEDGNTRSLQVPEKHAEPQKWIFVVIPRRNLILVELKGRGSETKISEYLSAKIFEWSNRDGISSPDATYDAVVIEAIPRESEPAGFLKSNPDLAQFEMRVKAEAVGENYGVFGGLFSGLLPEDKEYLTLKVEVSSSRRGGKLPPISLSTLSDVLEKIDHEYILHAAAKPVVDGKRTRPMKLLDALTQKSVRFDPQLSSSSEIFIQFANEIDVGEEIELNDE